MKMKKASRLCLTLLISISLCLTGCAHDGKKVLPESKTTVETVYRDRMQHSQSKIKQLRAELNYVSLYTIISDRMKYTQGARADFQRRFKRVKNPDILIYVYPHLSGNTESEVMIPGYVTMFPLYEGHHYALPGERA